MMAEVMESAWRPAGPAWLFCPADRPERFEKAAAAADIVILDLEDGVAAADRDSARQALIDTPLNPERTIVRINAHGTHDQSLDLDTLRRTAYTRIMVPKCESAEHVASLAPLEVIVLVESPLGVLNVVECVRTDNAIGVMWGAEDLVAGLGGTHSRHIGGTYRDVATLARSTSLVAAKAHGLLAVDSVYLDIADLDGLRVEADDAVAVGFDVKVAIHPKQTSTIREAFAPSEVDLYWARGLLAVAAEQRGVFTYEGKMVDAPVFRHAEAIVQRAGG